MSFAWLDYLVLAEALLQARTTLAPEEACCRAAISHAVYGAARTRAHDQEGLQLPATGDAHQWVITHALLTPGGAGDTEGKMCFIVPRHRAGRVDALDASARGGDDT